MKVTADLAKLADQAMEHVRMEAELYVAREQIKRLEEELAKTYKEKKNS